MELVHIYTKNEGVECAGRFVRLQVWGKNEYPHVHSLVLFKLSDSKETNYNALPVRMNQNALKIDGKM
jgi:hypothetical protein